jgi:glycosyltransferase involved in cell wall biosynthesis
MSSQPLICWIVVSTVPYHEARIKAAAARGMRVCIIQITEVDNFSVLQRPIESTSLQRYTLFPGTPWDEVDRDEMVRRLAKCLDEVRPGVVCINGWSFGGGISALKWGLRNDVPIVVMSESTAYDEKRHWWGELVKKRIVGLCSAALVGGAPHHAYMNDLGVDARTIFSGYDTVDNEHFQQGAARARLQGPELRAALALPERYFLACSRFTPKKNLVRLLDAYARYRRLHHSGAWSLVVVGDGEQRSKLQRTCGELKLTEDVILAGAKSYSDLPQYYGLAGAFVHASTTEQWGLVVNEAMASGLPVLVSNRCGCAPDLVEDGRNGFLFDPYDPSTLADAMYQLAAENTDRASMGRESQKIVSRWSPERFAEGLSAATRAALAAARPRPNLVDSAVLQLLSAR